jgi:hypothetical protein
MRRHELDPVSLTFGFAFTGLGLLFLVDRADQAFRLRWIWPILLLVLGVGILADLARHRGPEDEPVPAPGPDLARDPDPYQRPTRNLEPEATRDLEPEATRDLEPEADPDLDPDLTPQGTVDNREHPI